MKNLFEPTLVEDVKRRIMRLHPESERRWGKMPLAVVLAHCTSGLQMAMGTGDDKPIRRNSPSAPELFKADSIQCEFERERMQLIKAIESFVSTGAVCCSQHPHPFFGPLKPQQWAILMYKHVDHHLRQFGV